MLAHREVSNEGLWHSRSRLHNTPGQYSVLAWLEDAARARFKIAIHIVDKPRQQN